MFAGLVHTTLASSATAAPPAKALPVPGVCVAIPNAPPNAELAGSANAAPIERPINVRFMTLLLLSPVASYAKSGSGGRLRARDAGSGSRIVLLRRYDTRPARVVHRDIGERRLGYFHA